MNSLDTNILVYAANEDCVEHSKANELHNGVKAFHTRNTKDFVETGFEQLINPIDLTP